MPIVDLGSARLVTVLSMLVMAAIQGLRAYENGAGKVSKLLVVLCAHPISNLK